MRILFVTMIIGILATLSVNAVGLHQTNYLDVQTKLFAWPSSYSPIYEDFHSTEHIDGGYSPGLAGCYVAWDDDLCVDDPAVVIGDFCTSVTALSEFWVSSQCSLLQRTPIDCRVYCNNEDARCLSIPGYCTFFGASSSSAYCDCG